MFLETDERSKFSVATCNYIRYGRGGGQEIKNAICVLGLNMINDKVCFLFFFVISSWFEHDQRCYLFSSSNSHLFTKLSGVCNSLVVALYTDLCWLKQVFLYVLISVAALSWSWYPSFDNLVFVSSQSSTDANDLSWHPLGSLPALCVDVGGSQLHKSSQEMTQSVPPHFPEWPRHAWPRLL